MFTRVRNTPNSFVDEDQAPTQLSPDELAAVSGGGANVRHGNPGGEPASYNTPGNTDYGQSGGNYTGPGLDSKDDYM
jgi:hypothetical protein